MAKDPRRIIEAAARDVNREFLDSALSHAIGLERYKSGEVRKIVDFLNKEVMPDAIENLAKRLAKIKERGFDVGPVTTQRLKEALISTNELMRGGIRTAYKTLRDDLRELAITEAEWQALILKNASKGLLTADFAIPSIPLLRSIVTRQPVRGQKVKAWFDKAEGQISCKLQKQVSR